MKKIILKWILFQRGNKLRILKLFNPNYKINISILNNKFELDLNDKGISTDLAIDKIREKESVYFLMENLPKNCIVMDIGANIGYYVLLEAKIAKLVYAIEPSKCNYDRLIKNIELNNLSNILTYRIGIGGEDCFKYLNVYDFGNLSSFKKRNGESLRIEKVRVTTVDNFLKEKVKPNFIRMDVEGYEYEIFRGMKHTLKTVDLLFIELHNILLKPFQVKYILELLKENDFEVVKSTKSLSETEKRLLKEEDYDYSEHKIDFLLKNNDFINGRKEYNGCFEMFFKRNK